MKIVWQEELYGRLFTELINSLISDNRSYDSFFSIVERLFDVFLESLDGFTVFKYSKDANSSKMERIYFNSTVISTDAFELALNTMSDLHGNIYADSPSIFCDNKTAYSFLTIPICSSGVTYGYAVAFNCKGKMKYSTDSPQAEFLAMVMNLTSLIFKREKEEEISKYYHIRDYLTDLFTRDYIYEAIVYALQMANYSDMRFALLIVRVNGLKHINNNLGIFIGDLMIKEASALVKSAVTSLHTDSNVHIGRMSGCDFVVLLSFHDIENIQDNNMIQDSEIEQDNDIIQDNEFIKDDENTEKRDNDLTKEYCDAIIEKTENYVVISDHKIYPSLSIGASIFPYHGATVEELLRKADLAKSNARQSGANSYQIYDVSMEGDSQKVLFLSNNLPSALSDNQFELFYQAQVDFKTGKIIGAEALLRWRHPERGLIYPGEFIDYAEENGYGVQIDALVLQMACEQINLWLSQGIDLLVSVNISPKHFINGLIYDTVDRVLASQNIEPSMLKIELLESTLLDDFDTTIKVINNLREMGVAVALDDFGAGYSSLEYVAKLPLDYLKVDRVFSMNLEKSKNNEIILKTIMTLAKGMGVKTVVEGVETEFQYRFLREIGCDIAQGYLINKPLPINEFDLLLKKDRQGESVINFI